MPYRHGALDRTTSARVHGRLRPGTDLDPSPLWPAVPSHIRTTAETEASASQWLWLLLNEPARHRLLLADLYRPTPELAANAQAAREFFRIVRKRDIAAWPRWLEQARHTALAGFAHSVQRDEAAVMAALRLPWSNGPVESHVHRLKMLKRQMYGRAGFDLLRLRVLHAH